MGKEKKIFLALLFVAENSIIFHHNIHAFL